MNLNMFLPHEPDEAGSQRPGRRRRMLRRLGPSWAAAPLRRAVQVASLLALLVLMVLAAWPGDADGQAPSPDPGAGTETLLMLDPLVGTTAAIASRALTWSLVGAAGVIAVCLVLPRGFCGWLCPLGTLIDGFDWLVGKRVRPCKESRGWLPSRARYGLLAGVAVAAVFGAGVGGFVGAMPLAVRGLSTAVGLAAGDVSWTETGRVLSIALLAGVLLLGLLGRRFWCRSLCPTGALLSLAILFRLTGRKVTPACIGCGRCAEACSFDAIRDDFSTRGTQCAFCQTCGGICPTGAVTFAPRWSGVPEIAADLASRRDSRLLSRRGFLASAAGGAAGLLVGGFAVGPTVGAGVPPIRPPGSTPEPEFLGRCIRCGNCVHTCPSGVLQPAWMKFGLASLWTPRVVADRAGCLPECNRCGQVCPTGAIRALALEEKRACRMGRAVVDEKACLPHAGRQDCALCVAQCTEAGYHAIEFRRVRVEFDENGVAMPDSGFLAPFVLAEKCVGCGLCQAVCYGRNHQELKLLEASAIVVHAGRGNEDRLSRGSYRELREAERASRPPVTPTEVPYGVDLPDLPDVPDP